MTKKQANKAIVGLISEQIEKHPQLRLGQILANLDVVKANIIKKNGFDEQDGLVDEYYLESDLLLIRVKEAAARLKQES